MAKTAKGIIKDLAQDVEGAASEVVRTVGEASQEALPQPVASAYVAYLHALARLARATEATPGGAA